MLLTRRDSLMGLHTQPHRITSPVEARFAPAGKRFNVIGAVDKVSPFPVANSAETTPCEAAVENTMVVSDGLHRKCQGNKCALRLD